VVLDLAQARVLAVVAQARVLAVVAQAVVPDLAVVLALVVVLALAVVLALCIVVVVLALFTPRHSHHQTTVTRENPTRELVLG